jgi:hypothetical protein
VLLSHDEYQRLTNASLSVFQAICDTIGKKAQSRGLTGERLAEILADND